MRGERPDDRVITQLLQMLELPMSDEDFATLKQSSIRSDPRLPSAYKFHNQPPYRQMPARPPHATNGFTYGRPFQDEGDFSVEESMYAVNTPGRIDPFTK